MSAPIVVAVRIGPESAAPLAVATRLAKRLGAPLVIAYVAVELDPAAALATDMAVTGSKAHEEVRVRALSDFEALFPDLGVPYTFVLGVGPTAQELARIARENGADLLVAGTRGRGRLSRLILGDTTQEILREAPCSVVVVPPGTPPPAPS